MKDFLSETQINENIEKAKAGDNEAWNALCENFKDYVHKRAWDRIASFDMNPVKKKDIEEDLCQAGWQGFVKALSKFDLTKGAKFITYATYYIDGEISKELDVRLNTFGVTKRPRKADGRINTDKLKREDISDEKSVGQSLLSQMSEFSISGDDTVDLGNYSAERRALQIIELLKMLTDETHSLSKDELWRYLKLYRIAKYNNGNKEDDRTLAGTIEEILLELDPEHYSKESADKYRVKYKGYEEDRLFLNIENKKSDNHQKAKSITDFSYVHTFSNEELDKLISVISFSDMFTEEDKQILISKLISTASLYYKTPFWDGEGMKFNPSAVHGRFSERTDQSISRFADNIKVLQHAINNLAQVRFKFNRYDENYEMVPLNGYIHTVSPYHLVVYQDNYYCIGLKNDDDRIWHYRVDLMSDIEIVTDDEGKIIPIRVSDFEGLPISNAYWNPEKYMSEHLYMGYDKPRDILIKIKSGDYTFLHDWFGNHYEKTSNFDEEGMDIVKIETSPSMMVHWAMQYAGKVEVLDEEIRKTILSESRKVVNIYYEKTE